MNLLITGASGFVGTNFIENSPEFKIIPINLLTLKPDEINFKGINTVLHLAALVHQYKEVPEELYQKVNHELTINVAIRAKNSGVDHFIQMSTIAVYGNNEKITINTPYNPQTAYGRSKLAADKELLELQDNKFKVTIVRPPMVYGRGNAPGNMMRLIKVVDKGIPLPFKGIDNKRDFIHINNLVQFLKIIIEKQLKGIFLISDHESVSTEYLLTNIAKNLNRKTPLIKVPNIVLNLLKWIRPKEYKKLFGSLTIETNFPYEELLHRYTVEQGIKEMVNGYKDEKRIKKERFLLL